MTPPAVRQAILRRDAVQALLVSHYAGIAGFAVLYVSGWMLDRLEALSRRQRLHASDLAVLGGLEALPERLRG